ncbi:MAG: dipeptidyl aminopeptidase/acylaminoacyl peptidase [Myxococcota bacterium]|jgi:dipeptidyl aminopeptidase/acylaminoacyl peptidase
MVDLSQSSLRIPLAVASVVVVGSCSAATIDHDMLTQVTRVEQPRVNPNGGAIYLSDRSGGWEVWAASSAGDLRQLTNLGVVVESPTVAPSGQRMVVAADGGGNERYDLYGIELSGEYSVTRLTKTAHSESDPRLSPDERRLAWLSDEGTPHQSQLMVGATDATGGRALTKGETPVAWPVWGPESRHIALTRTADWSHGALVVVNVESGTTLTVEAGDGRMLRPYAFEPTGGGVLVTTTNAAGFQQLAIAGPDTGRISLIGPTDHDIEDAHWSADHGIIFSQNVGGQSLIARMEHPLAEVEPLVEPKGTVGSISVLGSSVVFDRTDSTTPPGIWQVGIDTHFERPLVARITAGLVKSIPFGFSSFDDRQITGFYYEPTGVAPHPAVVMVHGGPDSQTRDRFSAEHQALAAAGFVVVDINFRGSTGFGQAFTDLDNHDWGGGDRKDLRAAVEHLVALGIVDTSRVGIMGGSFGGYLALMALCKDGDLYRAGVDLYGMSDLVLDYESTRDRYGAWYVVEMGTPKTHAALFRDRSPLTWLDSLVAPLLVMHGENDADVLKSQSDTLVAGLKRRGRTPDYVVYPNEGHVFSRRENRKDVLDRIVAFFQRHLNETPSQ